MKTLLSVGLIGLLAVVPLVLLQALAWLMGHGLYWLPNKVARETRTNIARCLPDLDQQAQQGLVKQSLIHTAMMTLETGHNFFDPPERRLKRIKRVKGQALLEGDEGIILLTPHLGNWELFGSWGGSTKSAYCPL